MPSDTHACMVHQSLTKIGGCIITCFSLQLEYVACLWARGVCTMYMLFLQACSFGVLFYQQLASSHIYQLIKNMYFDFSNTPTPQWAAPLPLAKKLISALYLSFQISLSSSIYSLCYHNQIQTSKQILIIFVY